MQSNLLFVLKVMLVSTICSAAIEYACPYIPAIANNSLTASDLNAIALGAISLPVAIFGLFLWWGRERA